MARKPVFKTALGRRLADIRQEFQLERDRLAAVLETVSSSALANYERGDNIPDAAVLVAYRDKLGVDVGWIVTGDGDMFIDRSKAPAPRMQIDPDLLRKLHRAARFAYKDAGQRPPDEDSLTIEAARLYNELLRRVSDVRDTRLVEAAIPILIEDLKSTLAEASANPGTGKRSV